MARISFGSVNVRTGEDSKFYEYAGSPDLTIPAYRAQMSLHEAKMLAADLAQAIAKAEEEEERVKRLRFRLVPRAKDGREVTSAIAAALSQRTFNTRANAMREAWHAEGRGDGLKWEVVEVEGQA